MSSLTLTSVLSILSIVSAFPALSDLNTRANIVPFDAKEQYVSNQGEHAFMAPGPNDKRSPCPALNVLANHGYIPRNGYVSVKGVQDGLFNAFGINYDLGGVLSTILLSQPKMGDGYSIGDFPANYTGVDEYMFIQTYGIGDINADPLPMKQICDRYVAINGSQYRSADPFSSSGCGNDELFFRTFGNKSAEYPLGNLNAASKLAMLGMTPNGDGTFTWNKHMGAIPDYWYKSNTLALLNVPIFASDIVSQGAFGCYNGMSMMTKPSNAALLTNGVYTNADLADPQMHLCFLSQAAPLVLPLLAKQPGIDSATSSNITSAVDSVKKATANMQCSRQLKSLNLGVLSSALGLKLI